MNEYSSEPALTFRGRILPEPARPAGYAALLHRHELRVPLPPRLTGIAERHHPESTDEWQLLTPRHAPADTLGGHLEFALKWEGVNLLILTALFEAIPEEEVVEVVRKTPTGKYSRRIWFLYEWLTGRQLDLPDAGTVRAVSVLDPKQQFGLEEGVLSKRHRVYDNLPGTREFCPLVRRTDELDRLQDAGLDERARDVLGQTHPDVLTRAAAFLLLDDSRASFNIEGEHPSRERAARWGDAIGEAGQRTLSVSELERLQEVVIGDDRFVELGIREEGGFLGSHDRRTGDPIPEHVSARPEDLESLLRGLVAYTDRCTSQAIDPVIAAAAVAFGFVYIHPFQDGNGRIHRWLVHHVLARAGYNPPGVVFPVSAVILRRIDEYRTVLESYSKPLLSCCIDWQPTESRNVEVLNDTADYYRYLDATDHAEFLYRCVRETIERDLPAEVAYLEAFERFSVGVQQIVDMPDRTVDLLHRFLRQNGGVLSQRARTKEFAPLTEEEVERVERLYESCFGDVPEIP